MNVIKDIDNEFSRVSEEPNIKTNDVIHAIVDDKYITAHSNLTGHFPYRSSRGYQYICVVYYDNDNAILDVLLKDRPTK